MARIDSVSPRPPPAQVTDQLGSPHPGPATLQVLSEGVEVRQGVPAIDPLGLEAVLPPPGDELGERPVAVHMAHAIASADAEAGQVPRR
jgi:hypothetical protein